MGLNLSHPVVYVLPRSDECLIRRLEEAVCQGFVDDMILV
jgi:hypothetical protein